MAFEPFRRETGYAAPMPAANIDTDVIMPKVFLKGIDRSGLDRGLFHDLRFDEDGRPRSGFVLNEAPWTQARFLVTGPNFGCGSSREHAVWGLYQFGIRAIIATSFAGIFFDNCARNGVLAIEAESALVDRLMDAARSGEAITIDLENQTIAWAGEPADFAIDSERKSMLLHGRDPIDRTLALRDRIAAFERDYFQRHPWLA